MENVKNIKKNENGNHQKHIILVNLGLREYQHRIQHVGTPRMQIFSFVAARNCLLMTSLRQNRVPANPRSHANFQIFYSISCF